MGDFQTDSESTTEGRKEPDSKSASSTPDIPAAPNAPARRPNSGWFKKGQPGPRLENGHGLFSRQLPSDLDYIEAEVERFNAAALVDEGEAEADIPARRRSQLTYRGLVHR